MSIFIHKTTWNTAQGKAEGWRLSVDTYKGSKITRITVPRHKYSEYGLSESDSFEKAKEKLKTIQAQQKNKKSLERKIRISKRLEKDLLKESAFLPRQIYSKYLSWLSERRLWDEIPKKSESHLLCMRKMVLEVNLDPSEWPDKPEKIYRWFMTKKLSLSYIEKILPLVNDYGYFYCKEFKKPFLPVRPPMGDVARKIEDANLLERDGRHEEAAPLDESHLSRLGDLTDEQLRWMRISMYFGLRPIEIDGLTAKNRPKLWDIYPDENDTPILKLYQTKQVKLARERRWKRIPAILKQQRDLLIELDAEMKIRRPLVKTLVARLGDHFGVYSGRKGFEKMMRGYGQKNDNISRWLGHSNVKQTEKSYREVEAVEYDVMPYRQKTQTEP